MKTYSFLTEHVDVVDPRYEPPYTLDQIKKEYGNEIFKKFKNDPVHSWRANTGIELIHKEPNVNEFNRIWKNWNYMSDSMKKTSDKKSIELFGVNNHVHYLRLKKEY